MSIFDDPNFFAWFEERPPEIREAIQEYPPNRLYRLKSSGHIVVLAAYTSPGLAQAEICECSDCKAKLASPNRAIYEHNVTVKAAVLRQFNPHITMERVVFGIPLTDLEDYGALPKIPKQAQA